MTNEVTVNVRDEKEVPGALGSIAGTLYKTIAFGSVEVTLKRPDSKRSKDQNAKMWPMLLDIVNQKPEWPKPDGTMCKMTPDKYKGMLCSSLFDFELLCNANMSGMVGFGTSTSKLSKKNFCLLIEFIYAFGANHGVQWSEKAQSVYDEYREAQQ